MFFEHLKNLTKNLTGNSAAQIFESQGLLAASIKKVYISKSEGYSRIKRQ